MNLKGFLLVAAALAAAAVGTGEASQLRAAASTSAGGFIGRILRTAETWASRRFASCRCPHGLPTHGCFWKTQILCGSCDDGFHLNGHVCMPNICSCENGRPATGDKCTVDGGQACEACDAGFELLLNSCEPYVLANVAPISGKPLLGGPGSDSTAKTGPADGKNDFSATGATGPEGPDSDSTAKTGPADGKNDISATEATGPEGPDSDSTAKTGPADGKNDFSATQATDLKVLIPTQQQRQDLQTERTTSATGATDLKVLTPTQQQRQDLQTERTT